MRRSLSRQIRKSRLSNFKTNHAFILFRTTLTWFPGGYVESLSFELHLTFTPLLSTFISIITWHPILLYFISLISTYFFSYFVYRVQCMNNSQCKTISSPCLCWVSCCVPQKRGAAVSTPFFALPFWELKKLKYENQKIKKIRKSNINSKSEKW